MKSKAILIPERQNHYLLAAMAGFVIVGGIAAFPLSYFSGANCIIGACLLPFTFFRNGQNRFNWLYLLATVCFGALAFFYNMRVFYFLGLAGYLLFVVELFLGKIDGIILFLVILLCPIFSQVVGILGFPIRLHLSQWSGGILQMTGVDVMVEGNTMTLNGTDFAVDEACMGLNMMVISLLMGIFVILMEYRRTGLRLPLKLLLGYFAVVFILNVVSNLMRIVFLVSFHILPGDVWHDVVGVLCLVSYVMLPLYFLARVLIRFFGIRPPEVSDTCSVHGGYKALCGALGVTAMCIGFVISIERTVDASSVSNIQLSGIEGEFIGNGVTKFSNDDVLVYVKSIPQFFTSEHTPLFCWKGSGYEIKQLSQKKIAGKDVYTGILQKGDEKLYTAWWYFNGSVHTIDQFTWRTVMLKGGKGFSLINVTVSDRAGLHSYVERVLSKELFTFNEER